MIKRTLYFGNPAYLSLRNFQLVLKTPDANSGCADEGEPVRTFPIEDLGYVVLDHPRITITQGAVSGLLANNVAIVVCNDSQCPWGFSRQGRHSAHHRQTVWCHGAV